jgi:acyl-CoA dehydrogenase
VIAAKGFEKDTYFEMAARDIRALPKLEGTVHVNIALIVKFMRNYFFMPAEYGEVPRRDDPQDDIFLFNQGPARGLGKIQFQDFNPVFDRWDLPNANLFQEQIAIFKEFLMMATPSEEQQEDVDFLLAVGEIFTLVVYGHLILENAEIYEIDPDIVNQIFDFMVRDFSKFALELHNKPSSSAPQMEFCHKMLRKPLADTPQYERVWKEYVHALNGEYEMNA